MASINKIDYSKFLCEVYSPDGKYITRAKINAEKQFYCPSLVVEQDYYVVFSYDGILLQAFLFRNTQASKVVYLSPAHVIFNHAPVELPYSVLQAIKPLQQKCNDYQVPSMTWAKIALDTCIQAVRGSTGRFLCKHKPTPFRFGNELSGQVK